MSEKYTVLIEYLNPINACETIEGGELICVEADSESDASQKAIHQLYDMGYIDDDFCLVGSVKGEFSSLDEFWEIRNWEDELIAEEQRQYEEELAWQEYVNERFDFEHGDWKC